MVATNYTSNQLGGKKRFDGHQVPLDSKMEKKNLVAAHVTS
jgi:hypothetical protein